MEAIRRTTTSYTLLVFLFWFATALPLALLILLLQSRGLDLFEVSLLFGVNALVVVLLEVPTGSLADIVGRKRVSVWAAVLMMIGYGLFLSASSFPGLLLGSVVYGASRALASGALDAWYVDTVQALDPDIELQPLLARAGIATLLGLALGTLGGGIIGHLHRFLPTFDTPLLSEYSLPLIASLLVQLVRLLLLLLLVDEARPDTRTSWRRALASMPAFIGGALQLGRRSDLFRWLLLTTFAGGFVMVGIENFWQPHFAALLEGGEGNSLRFGIIMAGTFVAAAIGNMISTPLARRFGNRLGLLTGLLELLRGVALLLLVLQRDALPAGLFFWLVYLGMGIGGPAVGTMLHEEISARSRSTMLSIQSMVAYLGVFAGSLLLGVVAETASIGAAWLIAAAVLMALLVPFLRIDRLYRTASRKQVEHDDEAQLQTG